MQELAQLLRQWLRLTYDTKHRVAPIGFVTETEVSGVKPVLDRSFERPSDVFDRQQ